MHTLNVDLGERSYPIYIGQGLLNQPELLRQHIPGKNALVVTNTTVAPLYRARLDQALEGLRVETVVLPDGEAYKSIESLQTIWDALVLGRFDRNTTLIALGGGVIGDITGFAAASYQRGVHFIQIPTTLLAQVDSSVGGKTGINHPSGKNMIGAFWQPRAVIADTDTLNTLPDRELSAGLAEVIKYGLIHDEPFLVWIEAHVERLRARDAEALAYAICRSCEIKAEVVGQDEHESGLRAILNLGHTFGHAIETATGYGHWLHGEAVGAGMCMAARLSELEGWISAADAARIRAIIERAGLPTHAPQGMTREQFQHLMGIDKKVLDGKLRLVLLEHIGKARVTGDFSPANLITCLDEFTILREAPLMNATDAPIDPPHPLHERVELIVHLLKFSDRLFAIMSPKAEDLRIFADLLIKEGGADLLIARVHPDLALNAEDVATDLAKAWGIELNLGESAMQAIEQRLPKLLPEPRRAVAIIEDVERLPSHTLDELIGFMQRLDGQTGGRVRLALLGGPHLAGQLQHMQSLKAGGQVYALHLAPPPAESFANMATSVPDVPPPVFERPAPRSSEASTLPGRALLIGGVAASLALAVVIALLLRPGEPEEKKNQQVSVPLKSETVANLPVAPLPTPTPGAVSGQLPPSPAPTPIGHQPTAALTDTGKANATLPPLLAAPTSTSKPAAPTPIGHQPTASITDTGKANATLPPLLAAPTSTPKPATPTPISHQPTASITDAGKANATLPPLLAAPTSTPKPAASTPAARPAAEPKPSLAAPKPATQLDQLEKKTANWYAQQKGEQYVLQVVSLDSEAEVDRFIEQNGLKDCHSFRQLRDGQTLHTLTCGLYSSRDAASQASAMLPEKARVGKPFPRRIDDIRKIMLP